MPRARTDDPLAGVELALTRLMRQMTRPAVYRWLAAAGGVPLDRPSYGVLVRIAEAAPVRLTDLAESLGIDISTVSRQVRDLERTGLVLRTCDPSDQRASRLSLTEDGQAILARVRGARQEAMRRLLADWTETDQALLARLIGRLAEDMEGLGQQAAPVAAAPAGRADAGVAAAPAGRADAGTPGAQLPARAPRVGAASGAGAGR